MARVEFHRIDLQVIIRRAEDGGAIIRFGTPGSFKERPVGKKEVEAWLDLGPRETVPDIPQWLSFKESLSDWQELIDKAVRITGASGKRVEVTPRLSLDIIEPVLAAIDWERIFAYLLQSFHTENRPIVRLSSVRSRITSIPFTLPLRILHVDPQPGSNLKDKARSVFGHSISNKEVGEIIQWRIAKLSDFVSWSLPSGAPTAEILHFDSLPTLNKPQTLLSTAFPELPGTLGWLTRMAGLWQTRLIIINCNKSKQAADARRLATAIVNRGGPAILVCKFSKFGSADKFYEHFYERLIHDVAIDSALEFAMTFSADRSDFGAASSASLLIGAGREESLRFSTLGEKLIELNEALSSPPDVETEAKNELLNLMSRNIKMQRVKGVRQEITRAQAAEVVSQCIRHVANYKEMVRGRDRLSKFGISTGHQLTRLFAEIANHPQKGLTGYGYKIAPRHMRPLRPEASVNDIIKIVTQHGRSATRLLRDRTAQPGISESMGRVKNTLVNLQDEWNTFTFELHESEGIIPLSQKVTLLREQMGVRRAAAFETVAPKAQGPRYVNSSLWSVGTDGTLLQLDQTKDNLIVNEIYQLGIQIGPKDTHVRTVGAMALLEEFFKWSPKIVGVWVEIGVTGLEFEVLGDPVQEIWMPREAPSDMIYFAIVPRVAGVARLRYCLYFKQNLIQSFRLAAITLNSDQERPSKDRKKQLALALGIKQKHVGDARYLSRLEYSLTTSFNEVETRPPRSLSILANDLNGKTVVTVKGADTFIVDFPGDLRKYVKKVRGTLKEVSFAPIKGADPMDWPYNFGPYATPQDLKDALKKLARAGWELFDQIVPGSERQKVENILKPKRQTIHIAHVMLEKVIPWAVIYDRNYDDQITEDENSRPVAQDVCLAALPKTDGSLPAQECGALKECLLHKDQLARRILNNDPLLLPETVVCPLHFWGFKHIIEVPPHQEPDSQEGAQGQIDRILSVDKAQLVAGINAHLKLWSEHWTKLEGLTQTPRISCVWKSKATRRAALLSALKNSDIDFIYFYCHARGGDDDPGIDNFYLEIQDEQQQKPEMIRPSDLGVDWWSHRPLVFLNGCGTVGYSPDALSPFIRKMVRDRGAAGVIGTEVTVHEELATKVAAIFLENFLSGRAAGEAMLDMRCALLANNNPLGLVYTLYAAAHLMLANAGDGKRHKN